jgi:hypothetical protein
MHFRNFYIILSAAVTLLCAGCSGGGYPYVTGSTPTSSASQTIVFSMQPASQTVALGAAATFTVKANGVGYLSYQWTRNGTDIDGANSSTYTTPALTMDDNDASYAVVVHDYNGSASSRSATLTASPRAPKTGDLRLLLFQQATAAGLGDTAQASSLPTNEAQLFPGAVGSPLELGSAAVCQPGVEYGCGWEFFVESLPTTQNGLTMLYQGRGYEQFDSDLNAINAANVVIHSLDLEPANNAYGMAWVSTFAAGGFDLRREVVTPGEIAATAAEDGAESRVITAISFDAAGQANLLSYSWTGDKSTVFETSVTLATLDGIVDQAKALAAAGFTISAFGGNDANGYLLVGTRVEGDTLPRTLVISSACSTTASVTASASQGAYSTPVIRYAAADGSQVLISEY